MESTEQDILESFLGEQVVMESMDKSRWYTLQVMSGQERRVKDYLLNRRQQDLANGVDNGLVEVLVPTTRVLERKNGKTYEREQKCYPGYVFVRAVLFDDTGRIIPEHWLGIKETKGVINFMGGEHPMPLSDEEVQGLMQVEDEKDKPRVENVWKVGETVIIREGVFEGSEGMIEEVDDDRKRLKLSVVMFGRSTPCELDFWQVDRPQ